MMNRAVEVHTEQAELFGQRYRDLREDPFASAFVYGRQRVMDLLGERLLPGDGRLALDAGCGSGYWLHWLADNGFVVHGIDGSRGMVEQAQREVDASRLGLGDVRQLPFKSDSFDVALSIEVIRYLPDEQPALGELHRVLKPGGTAVVTAAPKWALHGYAFVNPVFTALKPPKFTALKQYFTTVGGLRAAMEAAGFRDVEVEARFLGPFTWLDRASPKLSQTVLRRWAPVDRWLAGRPGTRNLCNHLIAIGRK